MSRKMFMSNKLQSELNMSTKMPMSNEVRTLVLVGRTGNGKSSTGNSILGRNAFKPTTRSSSVTRVCELQKTTMKDKLLVNVINTPGLFDGNDSTKKEIEKCIEMAKDGIHAFLMVFSIRTRFSEEEQATFLTLLALFGDKIVDYMIVIFTGGDELDDNEETLDDYLGQECPKTLKDILILCDNRKVLFDNKSKNEKKQQGQIQQLLNLVDIVMSKNGGRPYTHQLFKELIKEKTTIQDNQQKKFNSKEGYFKEELLETNIQKQQKYDDQDHNELKQNNNKDKSRLKEESIHLSKNLEEERIARLKAEEDYESIKAAMNDEIEKLKRDLETTKTRPWRISCSIL